MLRHYESIGLLPRAQRTGSGCRVYRAEDVGALRFIRNARDLGFPLDRIEALLGLWRDRTRASAEVKLHAGAHVADLEEKIAVLQQMRDALHHLAAHCHGDDRPDWPIIEGLAGRRQPPPDSRPARSPAGAASATYARAGV